MIEFNFIRKLNNVGKDFILNITATVCLVGVSHLVVYPFLARKLSPDDYGLFLTIIGLVFTFSGAIGNSLNNVRLISQEEYFTAGLNGDYNFLLFCGLCFLTVLEMAYCFFCGIDVYYAILFWVLLALMTLRAYLCVTFLIEINYFKNLLLNLSLCSAYVFAVMMFWLFGFGNSSYDWVWIFVCGELIALIYLLCNSNLYRETFSVTKLFAYTRIKYLNLIYFSLIGGVMTYMDRNLIYPVLGGNAVATYFAATVVGKMVGVISGPLNGVILTHICKVGFQLSLKKFWYSSVLSVIIGSIFYGLILLSNDLIVSNLYPSLYEDAKLYFWVAPIAPLISSVISIIQPFVLKMVSLKMQSVFNTIHIIILGVLSYYASINFGLHGFIYAIIIVSLCKLVWCLVMGHIAIKNKGETFYENTLPS